MQAMAVIRVDDLEKAVGDILEQYFDGVAAGANEAVAKVAAETVLDLKASSPRGTTRNRHYADGWKLRQNKRQRARSEIEVYNTQYQLTHLLEHGHVKVVHGRVLGFTDARPHIAAAEHRAIKKLINGIERAAR